MRSHRMLPVQLVDVSSTGLGFITNEHLDPGDVVIVEYRGGYLIGEVVYSRPAAGGYRCGLQLHSTGSVAGSLGLLADAVITAQWASVGETREREFAS
jgi:hypothetical protein